MDTRRTHTAPKANGSVRVVSAASRRPSLAQTLAIKMESLLWHRRADSWDREGSMGLAPVVAAVLDACEADAGAVAVDLGCGSGQVTLPLARRCLYVLAVDLSTAALRLLSARAERAGVDNVHVLPQPIETLELAPGSVDLVVSNYALHHLRDRDKADLICRSFSWLRPGGRLVIGDMMLGRGVRPEDREVIVAKLTAFSKRGPAGWWRIAKNALRFLFRLQEKPLTGTAWEALAGEAGFSDVRVDRIRAEACVLSARKDVGGPRPERELAWREPALLEHQR